MIPRISSAREHQHDDEADGDQRGFQILASRPWRPASPLALVSWSAILLAIALTISCGVIESPSNGFLAGMHGSAIYRGCRCRINRSGYRVYRRKGPRPPKAWSAHLEGEQRTTAVPQTNCFVLLEVSPAPVLNPFGRAISCDRGGPGGLRRPSSRPGAQTEHREQVHCTTSANASLPNPTPIDRPDNAVGMCRFLYYN